MRLIIVDIGSPQTLFVGLTDLTDSSIDARMAEGVPIVLHECRYLRTILQLAPPANIVMKDAVTAMPVARNNTTMKVLPRAYWWPDQDKEGMRKLEQLIEACRQAEMTERTGLVS